MSPDLRRPPQVLPEAFQLFSRYFAMFCYVRFGMGMASRVLFQCGPSINRKQGQSSSEAEHCKEQRNSREELSVQVSVQKVHFKMDFYCH